MKAFTFEDSINEALKDPAFRSIWEANAVKHEITKSIIGERVRRKRLCQR